MKLDFSRFVPNLIHKVGGMGWRLLDYFRALPKRLWRITRHLFSGLLNIIPLSAPVFKSESITSFLRGIGYWWLEFTIYVLECLGVGELYETMMDLVKFNTRPLYDWEIQLAKTVFGNSINYHRVRIDEMAILGPRQKHFCYVSFYIINSWGGMQNATLVHELTHIWQYEQLGAVYMPRALYAQASVEGYNYGGIESLKTDYSAGKHFTSFNLEQQGDIVSDYYRIREGYSPQWGCAGKIDLPIYEHFISQLKG